MNLKNSPYKISPLKSFDKEVVIPTSKSHCNRALILGAIRGGNFKVHNVSTSTDVAHLLNAFQKIGLRLKMSGNTIIFENSFPECEKEIKEDIIELHTGDGGTTNRFLLGLLSRGKKEYHLYPTEKMKDRPIEDLIRPLKSLGVSVLQDTSGKVDVPWIKLKGPATLYNTTKLQIDCQKSTQFASALMLAFSSLPLQFEFLNLHASEAYLKMTSQVIKNALESNAYTVPVDFSSLGYPAAMAALKGRMLATNCLEIDDYQADSGFIDVLKNSGAFVSLTKAGLEIKQQDKLRPISFNVSQAPDLFPTLAFLAAHIDGESLFSRLEVLKYKESDRLEETIKLLSHFGVSFDYDAANDVFKIHGSSSKVYQKATIHPPRDHRMVMSAALFMMKNAGGDLFEVDCVEKSFPNFFSLLE